MTCPHCSQALVDGGQSGSYCQTPGCSGNYYGGNAIREEENAYLKDLIYNGAPGSWRAAIDYRESLPHEESMGRWWPGYEAKRGAS